MEQTELLLRVALGGFLGVVVAPILIVLCLKLKDWLEERKQPPRRRWLSE